MLPWHSLCPLCSPDTWAYHPQSWSEALTSTLKRGPPITQHCLWHRCGAPCLPLAWADPHQLAMLLPSHDGCKGDRMIERAGLGLRITPMHNPSDPTDESHFMQGQVGKDTKSQGSMLLG